MADAPSFTATVMVLEVRNYTQENDFYFSVKLGDKKLKGGFIKPKAPSPYNEKFEFPSFTTGNTIRVSMKKSKKEFIGHANVPIMTLSTATETNFIQYDGWWALNTDVTPKIEIHVGVSFKKSQGGPNRSLARRGFAEQSARNMQHLFRKSAVTQTSWEICSTELEFLLEVGEGTSAKVFKGRYRNQNVAIKVLKERIPDKEKADFVKELEIMKTLKSSNIVLLYGAAVSPQTCIVMEWCPKGSLHTLLQLPTEPFNWEKYFHLARQIGEGVSVLHNWKPQIVHRDLKSQNLLVSAQGNLKVCDFGLARLFGTTDAQTTLMKLRGTFHYTAPEIYNKQIYTPKSDIYSVGVILWEVLNRVMTGTYQQPFSEFSNLQFDFQILIQVAKSNLRPTIPPKSPPAVVSLITSCWDHEPDNRPDVAKLLEQVNVIEEEYNNNKSQWNPLLPS
eukprot:TRINITY_DN6721_c0_g1_i1.p1 TRINITY_DN6721_c0_g1~~TRINITY_DN6721_c0_g1_i1.p1  ORF type:complete len:447 (-),score=68.95 TRINITY_DN6721_c0_g1_i1:84-1424(-)